MKQDNRMHTKFLRQLSVRTGICARITMDFIVHPQNTDDGYDAVIAFTEVLTKLAKFAPTTTTAAVTQLATIFISSIVRPVGEPRKITSDRDTVF